MSVKLQPETIQKLRRYHELLLKWQNAVNLVAPSTLGDAWNRHFEDSLQVLDMIPADAKVLIDIGSGAGFPGLVLAIARPDLTVHLVESDQKKGAFLLNVSREIGAKNVNVHSERIESVLPKLRGDVVTARALAGLPQLLAMTESQWSRQAVGDGDKPATLVFMKGADWRSEVDLANQDHDFQVTDFASKTNQTKGAPNGAILCITQVQHRQKS